MGARGRSDPRHGGALIIFATNQLAPHQLETRRLLLRFIRDYEGWQTLADELSVFIIMKAGGSSWIGGP